MTYTYQVTQPELGGINIIRIDEDGVMASIPSDLGNSDYQRYLRWVENPNAEETNYLTAPAIMESTQPDEADLTEGNN
jgi:hypothetical protein